MDLYTACRIFVVKTVREKKYFWMRNVFNVIIPLLFFLVFVLSDASDKIDDNENIRSRSSSEISDILDLTLPSALDRIYYVPSTTFNANLMETFRRKHFVLDEQVIGFKNEAHLWNNVGNLTARSFVVIFNEASEKRLSYTIRSMSNRFHTDKQYSNKLESKLANQYISDGFLALQHALDMTFFELVTKQKKSSFDVEVELLKTPSFNSKLNMIGIFIIIFSSLFCISLILARIMEEKSTGFRELVKNATRFSFLNNFVFAIVSYLQMLLLLIGVWLITLCAGYWFSVNVIYAIMLIVLFITSIICYTYFVSALFDSVTFSTVGAVFWYFVPFYCHHFASNQIKKYLMIFPVNALHQGFQIFHDYTNAGHFFSHHNFSQTSYPNDGLLSMAHVFFWLIISPAIFAFLYFYISNVWPGRFGIKQSFYFIFNPYFYCSKSIDMQSDVKPYISPSKKVQKFKNANDKAVIKIRNLKKTYGKQTVVDHVSIDIFENEITMLLGPNGSGKSVMLSIVAGFTYLESGDIYTEQKNDVQFYRSSIGYCPPRNIFLPYLTCLEHLEFFGQLRGLSKDDAKEKGNDILKQVNLDSKADDIAEHLSASMLRRLCLANAIIGNTKLLILDDPTGGLDSRHRIAIRDLLIKLKEDHTIVITSQVMYEVEGLGDKIAIMKNSDIIAYGTSKFLKKLYGPNITFEEIFLHEEICGNIKEVEPVADDENTLISDGYYYDDDDATDTQGQGETPNEMDQADGGEMLNDSNPQPEPVPFIQTLSDSRRFQRQSIYFRQFRAIFYKKSIYWYRNFLLLCTMITIPILIAGFCCLLYNYPLEKSHKALQLNMNGINEAFIYVNFKLFRDEKMETVLESYVKEQKAKVYTFQTDNIDQKILELSTSVERYYDKLIGVIEFDMDNDLNWSVKIRHSQNVLHSAAILMNIVDSVMLKYHMDRKHAIEVTNSPLFSKEENISYIQSVFVVIVPIGIMLMMIMFLPFTHKEKTNGFKHYQNIPSLIYWLAEFLSDLFVYLLVVIVIMLITVYGCKGFSFNSEEIVKSFIFYLLYGATNLIITYITSQCFPSLNSSNMFLNYLHLFSLFGVFMLSNSKESMAANEAWILMLYILPDFALKHSLKVIYENHELERNVMREINDKQSEVYVSSINEYQFVLGTTQFFIANILVLALTTLFFVCVENQKLQLYLAELLKYFRCFRNDEEVEIKLSRDTELIKRPDNNESEALEVSNMEQKSVKHGSRRVIDFTVKRGECFGLIGLNETGKSSIYELMTLSKLKTNGTISINGVNSDEDPFHYRQMIGYCPQVDVLCEYMTAYQQLKFMMKIRGQRCNINEHVRDWLLKIDIVKSRDKKVAHFSRGTKRKLNTAMAMITDPFVILLDEPTTGVDPKSRQFIAKCILSFRQEQKAIVFTSLNQMEYVELCDRVGRMKNGEITATLDKQQLRETINEKLRNQQARGLRKRLQGILPR